MTIEPVLGFLWFREGEWVAWTDLSSADRYHVAFSPNDPHGCHEALGVVIRHVDPEGHVLDWVVVAGHPTRKERYEQWTQDPSDDFLANLQTRIEPESDYHDYYKLIAERPLKKVEYVVGAFRLAANIEYMVADRLPRSSRIRWVPMGYLATQGAGEATDPVILLFSTTQTVALCMDKGEICNIRVFQFSIERCLEQLRRDQFSPNQAKQFLEIEFSFLTYSQKDRLLSLKIEVDQFLDDLKRLLLTCLGRPDQPIYIAADAFNHHDVMPAVQRLTANPVTLLNEKMWVREGATKWSHHQERFLPIPKSRTPMSLPSFQAGKTLPFIGVAILLVLIAGGNIALKHRLSTQLEQLSETRNELMVAREAFFKKFNKTHPALQKRSNP